jgi:hypothetical protein
MASAFEFHNEPVKLIINPAEVAAFHEDFGRLRTKLAEKYGGDFAKADAELARRLFPAVESFGNRWMARISGALDHIVTIREHLKAIRDGVLKGEMPRAEVLRDDFAKLDAEMKKLVSPRQALGDTPVELGPKGASLLDPIGELIIGKALGDQGETFGSLDKATQANLRSLADTDPAIVRQAIVSEGEGTRGSAADALAERLKAAGKSPDEIKALRDGLEKLSKAWQNEQTKYLPADHVLNIAKIIGELPSEDLKAAVAASEKLRKMAYDNPKGIKELWDRFKSRKRKYKSFEKYVKFCDNLTIGNVGEYALAFGLGDEWALLKGPDAYVYHPGTDVVAVNLKTGEVWIFDNKSFSAEELDAVNALTRNLPKNMADDVADFQGIAGHAATPPEIAGPIDRLAKANAEIQAKFGGLSKSALEDPVVQREIGDILESHGVQRVVSNAGGQLQRLAPHLMALKILFADFNA